MKDQSKSISPLLAKLIGYATISLVLAVLFFFLILPVGTIISKAFITSDGRFTFEYFQLLFANDLNTNAIKNSLALGLCTTLGCFAISLPLAIINTRYQFFAKPLFTGLLLVPMVMPPFVGAIAIIKFFAQWGSVNLFLFENGWIESPIEWLSDDRKFWAVVILEMLHLYPIMYLNLSAALANVDPSLEEAATTFGASRWRRYRQIVWPLAAPGLFAGAIIVFIWSLTDLGTPLLVGFHTAMPVKIFSMVADVKQNPVGFALVVFVVALTVGIFLLSKFAFGGKKYEMMAKGHVTSAVKPASFFSSLVIYPFLSLVIIFALAPHIAVLITSFSDGWSMTVLPENYTLEHYFKVFQKELPMTGIRNSLLLATGSTLVDIGLGLLVAYVVVRKLIPLTGLLDGLVMTPLALPGIVLAFGYVVTYTDTFLDPMVNPVPLLIIAYAIRRLPFMVRSASAGLQQTSISLEEASATFGASKFYTIRKIVIPLVMANLIAGGLLCFAYAMLDVSDSLILAMKDQYYPLTKAIYAIFQEPSGGDLVASALGVIGMLILGVCIMTSSLLLGKKMGELFRS